MSDEQSVPQLQVHQPVLDVVRSGFRVRGAQPRDRVPLPARIRRWSVRLLHPGQQQRPRTSKSVHIIS